TQIRWPSITLTLQLQILIQCHDAIFLGTALKAQPYAEGHLLLLGLHVASHEAVAVQSNLCVLGMQLVVWGRGESWVYNSPLLSINSQHKQGNTAKACRMVPM